MRVLQETDDFSVRSGKGDTESALPTAASTQVRGSAASPGLKQSSQSGQILGSTGHLFRRPDCFMRRTVGVMVAAISIANIWITAFAHDFWFQVTHVSSHYRSRSHYDSFGSGVAG